MEELRDLALIEGDILNNFARMLKSRDNGEKTLEQTFERRMNRGLDEWREASLVGELAVGLASEAAH